MISSSIIALYSLRISDIRWLPVLCFPSLSASRLVKAALRMGNSQSLHVWDWSDTLTNSMDMEHLHRLWLYFISYFFYCLSFLFSSANICDPLSPSQHIPTFSPVLVPIFRPIYDVTLPSVEMNSVQRGSEVLFVLLQSFDTL